MKVREIGVTLPHPALPGADWADCFEGVAAQPGLTAAQAARQAFATMPAWVGGLMALRNLVVRPFSLKGDAQAATADGEGVGESTDQRFGQDIGQRIGMFPVVAESDSEIVLGFDDRHLDFRIVVETEPSGDRTCVRLMTLVRRHNRLGRVYLATILPFHKLIVASTLARLAR